MQWYKKAPGVTVSKDITLHLEGVVMRTSYLVEAILRLVS